MGDLLVPRRPGGTARENVAELPSEQLAIGLPGFAPARGRGRTAAREQTRGFHGCDGHTRRPLLGSRTRVTPSVATPRVNGDEMKTQFQFSDRDPEATTSRFRLGLFVVAELLCTGALVAAAIHWM